MGGGGGRGFDHTPGASPENCLETGFEPLTKPPKIVRTTLVRDPLEGPDSDLVVHWDHDSSSFARVRMNVDVLPMTAASSGQFVSVSRKYLGYLSAGKRLARHMAISSRLGK